MIKKIAVFAIGCWLISNTAYAQSISSAELINKAKRHDGKIVTYEGEVIGDIMKRDAYAWLNVSDGANAIGVWVDNSLIKEITHTGVYKSKGDKVKIIGVFHRACIEHGGDLDIHVQSVQKISSGSPIPDALDIKKAKTIGVLLGVIIFLWFIDLLVSRKKK